MVLGVPILMHFRVISSYRFKFSWYSGCGVWCDGVTVYHHVGFGLPSQTVRKHSTIVFM